MTPPSRDPIQDAFQALSRKLEPSAPVLAREAIFKAAAEAIQDQSDITSLSSAAKVIRDPPLKASTQPMTLSTRWRAWFFSPWPYGAATAMLALIAVTVAVRVQTEADAPEQKRQGQSARGDTSVQADAPVQAKRDESVLRDHVSEAKRIVVR